MNNDNICYADDGTRFSSIIERDHYNEKLKKEKEEEVEGQ